jgi:EamA domain-containing membrane protein RarD
MLFFAVSVLAKLQNLPRRNLVNLGLAVLVIVVAVVLIKEAAKMNRLVLYMIIALTVVVVGFSWVYERNEPKFLTPVVDVIAPFFPSKPRD